MLNFSRKLNFFFLKITKKIGYVGKNNIENIMLLIINTLKEKSKISTLEIPNTVFKSTILKNTNNIDVKENNKKIKWNRTLTV